MRLNSLPIATIRLLAILVAIASVQESFSAIHVHWINISSFAKIWPYPWNPNRSTYYPRMHVGACKCYLFIYLYAIADASKHHSNFKASNHGLFTFCGCVCILCLLRSMYSTIHRQFKWNNILFSYRKCLYAYACPSSFPLTLPLSLSSPCTEGLFFYPFKSVSIFYVIEFLFFLVDITILLTNWRVFAYPLIHLPYQLKHLLQVLPEQ